MTPTHTSPVITGRGMYLPKEVLTNEDLAGIVEPELLAAWIDRNRWCQDLIEKSRDSEYVDLEEEELNRRLYVDYVEQRIGIRRRHVVDREAILERRSSTTSVFGSDLGARAAQQALEAAGVSAGELDIVICGTSSPDQVYPATAIEIQEKIGARNAYAFDLLAACSSFVYGLEMTRGLILSGICKRALIVAAEYFSCGVDYRYPDNSFFWGDGAAAAVMEAADLGRHKEGYQLLDSNCQTCLSYSIRTGLGGTKPFLAHSTDGQGTADGVIEPGSPGYRYFYQDGSKVYREVIPLVVGATEKLLQRNGYGSEDVRLFMFHQASALVLRGIMKRLLRNAAISDRVPMNLTKYGNTSSCGVAICLAEESVMQPGELACMTAFGAGYTVGGVLLRKTGSL